MRFGDIKEILDKYTVDCRECKDNCDTDCSNFWVKQVNDEIMALFNKEIISPIPKIPCKLHYKGMVEKLPDNAEYGDTYTLLIGGEYLSYVYEEDWHLVGI